MKSLRYAFLAVLLVFLAAPVSAQSEEGQATSSEMIQDIVLNPRLNEITKYDTWDEGMQHLIDSWEELQQFLSRPDALEAITRAYRSILIPKQTDTIEEKRRIVFAELLLQRLASEPHNQDHEHHEQDLEQRITSGLKYKLWDKFMAGYEEEYFTYWPEHGKRQDQIPFFYSAYPAMAYRVAITRLKKSDRFAYMPPGQIENMSTPALIQVVIHSPDSVRIWNNKYLGQMSGHITINWYQHVREVDPARELMMFREEAPQEILRYYQSLHLTDDNYEQFMNPITVCEIFLRQQFVNSKLTPDERKERDNAFADKFIEKLRYREQYKLEQIPQWIAYEDMVIPLQYRRWGFIYISELKAMPHLALQVMKRAL